MLGIRPEHFTGTGKISLPVTVEVAEHLGGASLIHANGNHGDTLVIQSDSSRSVKAGDSISARFDVERAFLFDDQERRVR